MRFNPIPLITFCLVVSFSSLAQMANSQTASPYNLLLKSGTITPEKNITAERVNSFNHSLSRSTDKSFVIIQFDKIPTQLQKQQLLEAGIELLDYVPNNAYTATINGNIDLSSLSQTNARGIVELTPYQKMSVDLAVGNFRPSAVKVAGTVDVRISFPKSYLYETVSDELRSKNFDIINVEFKDYRILSLRVSTQRLAELALLPFVEYVESVPGEDQLLSPFWTNWGRDGVRSSILTAPISQGGKNLKGTGVVVGVGDDADFQLHVDFTNRLINRADAPYSYHGTHVAGIVGGAGIINEVRTGFAPKSTILSQVFQKVFANAPAYIADHGMVITNNSYGNDITDCNTFGLYDLYSKILDNQAVSLSNLQTVFAAGNSGLKKCGPFPDSFRTVLGGYQAAKNIITVGNASPIGTIYQSSSRGPVRDGRVKPEIVAIGAFIESTVPVWGYGENTGTSMSSPAIAGGLALLYEKYRLQNAGANPKNGLMKALVCNSGDDWGNPGPDFTHGFGVANFSRAVDMLENNRLATGNILPTATQTIPIVVPVGVAELKVMLYWNDPAAAAVSFQTLVNDLDLEVETPLPSTVLPLVLDTGYLQVKNNAHNGVDNINNIEQVVIKNPAAGNYNIKIKATNITQNPSQEYFIVYDFVPTETKLVAPFGGETYLHGENMVVRWDSYGDPQNDFTLEYSTNDGASWTTLKNNIEANKRLYFYTAPNPNEWFVIPSITTDKARVRISRNGTGFSSTSLPFVISDTITASLSTVQCEGYFSIDWTAEPAATGYEVMMLRGDEMVSVVTVPNTTFTYTISGLSKDSIYWASVRPLIGTSNSPGRRAISVSRQPNNGTCVGIISDNDIKLDSILSPAKSGRLLTSTALGNNVPVTIRIKNLDDVPTTGNITVSYILNAGVPVVEVLTNPGIAGGATLDHTFATTINLSAAGTYTLETFVSQTGDPVAENDTKPKVVKQLLNPAITGIIPLSPFIDNFDAAPIQSYNTPQIGLTALDRYDFVNSNANGRIRTFINTGIAYSGNRAITLDASINNAGTTDSLTGTYNLDTYDATMEDLRLDFRFKNHGQVDNGANKVWVRGSDMDDWVQAYDLYANQNAADAGYKLSSSIEISDVLQNAVPAQVFTTSFQVRWGQYGQTLAADNSGSAGYTFDDIRLYKVTDDIQMVSIDTPIVNSCNLSASTPVQITIRNSSNTIIPGSPGIPVRYKINGGGWVAETITTAIAANSNFQYTFSTGANLLATGSYLIEAEVMYASDDYHENDTTSVNFVNTPLIVVTNATPYLQNFETDNGNWYGAGKNSSWEYGTPTSYKINRAASGSKAWKTRIAGNYNDSEKSYLYSPCFDVSSMTAPSLSFSLSLDIEDCGNVNLCDGAYVEYSLDGKLWDTLGAYGQGTNWYNKDYASGVELWSIQDYHRWHVATIPLSAIPYPVNALTQLRFRFVMSSDAGVSREGIAVDDIHIYSNTAGIYDGVTMGTPVTATIPGGTGWVDFLEGGKLIASVNSPVAMGSTDAQAYIHTGPHRISSLQFYHNRNITIKPTTTALSDSAIVRFYFLDTETDTLIKATGCGYCLKPTTAYELGVTKYSDANDNIENGTLADNVTGNYLFINSAKTKIIPFDKGYYAEFKVKDFSEFWLSNGGIDKNTPLPLKLLSFTANKLNTKDVVAAWTTSDEYNINRFEIEVARGNNDYQLNKFTRIEFVNSQGNSGAEQRYSFTDVEINKSGVRYYRLKIIEADGSFSYSAIRPVVFTNDVQWQVYPNPSAGVFNLTYQLADGESLTVRVYDATGKAIKQYSSNATGFLQKMVIDLQAGGVPSGLYMLEAEAGGKKQFFKLLKQ